MFENSTFYEYFDKDFTEHSRLIAVIKNEDYLNEISRLEKVLPLTRTEVLLLHRDLYYWLPLYWCDDIAVQAALKANLLHNYTLSPLEVHPGISGSSAPEQNPLPENVLEILRACLVP